MSNSNPFVGEPLWFDDSILAFSKPSGLLTIRDGFNPDLPFLADEVARQFGPIWVVHRLDRDTSGVILFARSADIHRHLSQQFQDRRVKKLYRAIIHRHPTWDEFHADFNLQVNGDRMHRTVIDTKGGKLAATTLRVITRYIQDWSLISAEPHTGYTHQIRAHAAWLGHPIANDTLYRISKRSPFSPETDNLSHGKLNRIDRLALHASSIEFHHPDVAHSVKITAPDPPDFAATIATLTVV